MNDLNSNQTSEDISTGIVNLATSSKNNQHDVSVSDIILRTDNSKLNATLCEVNQIYPNYAMKENRIILIKVNFI